MRRHQLYGFERPQVQREHDRLWQDVTVVVLPYVSLVLVEESYIQQRPPVFLNFFMGTSTPFVLLNIFILAPGPGLTPKVWETAACL